MPVAPDPVTAPAHAPAPVPAAGGDYTPQTFAAAVLMGVGAPVTAQNVTAMVAWEAAEGGHWQNSATYNPLNTTLRMPGSSSMNSVGVQAYTSWAQGVTATVQTLSQSNMSGIVSALRKGNDAAGVVTAVLRSPWGTQGIALSEGNDYNPTTSGGAGGGRGYTPSDSSGNPSVAPPAKANDWIAALDHALNPSFGWDPLKDTAGAIQLVAVRGGLALLGIVVLGTGLLLAFGKEIFGGALLAIPGVGEAAGALDATKVAGTATRAAGTAGKAAGAAKVAGTRAARPEGR